MESVTLLGRRLKIKSGIYFLVVFFLFSQFAVRQLHMPGAVTYVGDLVVLGLLVTALLNRKGLDCLRSYALGITVVILLFLLQTVIGFFGNGHSPLLYIWGLRRVFAPYIYLLACIVLLDLDDIEKLFRLLEVVFVVNFLLSLVQFALGYSRDLLGGIYGTGVGTNGFLNIFLCQVVTVQVVRYLHHSVSLKKLACYLVMALTVALLAELKALFVEVVLIVALAAVLSKPSKKTWYIIGAGVVGIAVAIPLLYKIYPYFDNFFSWEFLSKYLGKKGYTVKGDLNRISGVPYIWENFLTTPFTKMFGLGLGNTEYSGFSFFTSEFYRTYQDTLHYSWFAHLMYLLENGLLGFACFAGVFVAAGVKAFRMKIRSHPNRDLLVISCISAVLGLFYAVYNATLRDYNAHILVYLFVALPFVADKCCKRKRAWEAGYTEKGESSQNAQQATSVSVVVPVYNVEVFLSQCVESLLAQTHKNLEIILVDDGATDSSGKICDEYAAQYPHIRVVHKKNGGLSSARNAGIEVATGELLAFVDSDDFVEPDMIATMVEGVVVTGAKVAACGRYRTDEAGKPLDTGYTLPGPKEYSVEEAIAEILSFGAMDVSVADKIFYRELFEEIRFPEGEVNEDAAIIFRLLDQAEAVVHVGKPLYYYRGRTGSITQSRYSGLGAHILDHADEAEAYLLNRYPGLKGAFRKYRAYLCCNLLAKMLKDPESKKGYPEDYRRCITGLRRNWWHLLSNFNVPTSWKARGTAIVLGLYEPLYALRRKRG